LITEKGWVKEINVEQKTTSYGSKLMEELIGYIPKRTKELRQRCVDATPEVCVERARLITEAYEEYGSLPVTMKRAMTFEKILNEMSLYIQSGELIVGNLSSKLRAAPIYPEYDVEFILKEIEGFPTRPGDPFVVREEVKRELIEICGFWKGGTVRERVLSMLPHDTRVAGEDGVAAYDSAWTMYNGDGHIAADYPKVLRVGIKGILREIDERLESLDLSDPENLDKLEFLKAAKICNMAMINFARRFSRLASDLAEKEENVSRKEELAKIAEICLKVPEHPAENFHEALQSLWLVHLAVQIETNGHSVSLGRFDQYMYSFYAADIEAGALTREEALELMQCFWIKLSELTKIRPTDDANLFPGYPMFQNLTIGG